MQEIKRWLLTSVLMFPFTAPAYATDWQRQTLHDLSRAKQLVSQYSIAFVPQLNTGYAATFERAYLQARKKAMKVTTAGGYFAVLSFMGNALHDEHYSVMPLAPLKSQLACFWPGFSVQKIGEKYRVSYPVLPKTQALLPPKGAELISCDNKTPSELIKKRVFPYFGDPRLSSDWQRLASYLFADFSNPWVKRVKHCKFSQGGRQKHYQLHWQPIAYDKLTAQLKKTVYPNHYASQVAPFGKNSVWLNLPDFHIATNDALKMISSLIAQAESWQDVNAVVIDLRGNGGGNSAWGDKLLSALYGENFFKARLNARFADGRPPYEVWRVSPITLDYLEKATTMLGRQLGKSAPVYQQIQAIKRGVKNGLQAGQSLYVVPYKKPIITTKQATPPPRFKGKIIAIINGQCGSSCLTFVSHLIAMPNATLFGKATAADSIYTEFYRYFLTDGWVRVNFPLKATQHRLRGNVPYQPSQRYSGDLNDTPALKKAVLRAFHPL